MKTLLLCLIVAAPAVLATGADTASLTGTWQVHNSISGNESDQSCKFTEKDGALTGECTSNNGNVQISGRVDGTKVTWSYKSQYEGTPLTVNYEGTVESASKITGTVNVPEFAAGGEFTATQSK